MPLGFLRSSILGANTLRLLQVATFVAMIFIPTNYLQQVLDYSVVRGDGYWSRKIFWLSTVQHPHICIAMCKLGYEFEIKTDNSLEHSTLPPSIY
jgi:hypothetical protein